MLGGRAGLQRQRGTPRKRGAPCGWTFIATSSREVQAAYCSERWRLVWGKDGSHQSHPDHRRRGRSSDDQGMTRCGWKWEHTVKHTDSASGRKGQVATTPGSCPGRGAGRPAAHATLRNPIPPRGGWHCSWVAESMPTGNVTPRGKCPKDPCP